MSVIQHAAYETLATPISAQAVTSGSRYTSSTVDNTTLRNLLDDVELVAAYSSAPTAGTTLDLYLIASLDGTNWGLGADTASAAPAAAPPVYTLVASFPVVASATTQRFPVVRDLPVPALNYRYTVHNNTTGQTATITLNRRGHEGETV